MNKLKERSEENEYLGEVPHDVSPSDVKQSKNVSWSVWAFIIALPLLFLAVWFAWDSLQSQKAMEDKVEQQQEIIDELNDKIASDAGEEADSDDDLALLVTNEVINEKLSSLQELVTTEYIYTNAGQYTTNKTQTILKWDIDVPLTKKSFIVCYEGRIKAGVDLSMAKVEIDEDHRTIDISLPKSKILSHETFEDSLEVLDESDGIFNKITIDDYNNFVSGQKADMEQKAVDRGLLISADKEAKSTVEEVLSLLPGMEAYKLTIKQL